MMSIKCECGEPMRYVGKTMVLINLFPTELVGIECHDLKCRKNRVMRSDKWTESLEPLRSWPDNVVFNG